MLIELSLVNINDPQGKLSTPDALGTAVQPM